MWCFDKESQGADVSVSQGETKSKNAKKKLVKTSSCTSEYILCFLNNKSTVKSKSIVVSGEYS